MPPKRVWTPLEAQRHDCSISKFFKPLPPPPPGPGRPQKAAETRGRPKTSQSTGQALLPIAAASFPAAATSAAPAAAATSAAPAAAVDAAATSAAVQKKGRQAAAAATRQNWSTSEMLPMLTEAVNNWLEKKGSIIEAHPDISCKHYSARVEIPFEMFRKYVCSNIGKRRVLGAFVGAKQTLPESSKQFLVVSHKG